MFKKVNAREKLIGWYHSGPKLRASDLLINELFKKYTPNPLLVIIDVQPKEVGVPTDAYFAVEEIKDVSWICLKRYSAVLTKAHRMAPLPAKPLYIPHQSSRLRRRRKSELNTSYATSEMSQSALFPLESLHSYSRFKVYISAYATLGGTWIKLSMASSPSTTQSSDTCKTSSTSFRTSQTP